MKSLQNKVYQLGATKYVAIISVQRKIRLKRNKNLLSNNCRRENEVSTFYRLKIVEKW